MKRVNKAIILNESVFHNKILYRLYAIADVLADLGGAPILVEQIMEGKDYGQGYAPWDVLCAP
jgi:hypothetical protein